VAAALLNQLDSGGALTVDASITAKPFFERRGFRVVQQQSVVLRGQHFINFHLRRAGAK
jgi:putative acetyltransferase